MNNMEMVTSSLVVGYIGFLFWVRSLRALAISQEEEISKLVGKNKIEAEARAYAGKCNADTKLRKSKELQECKQELDVYIEKVELLRSILRGMPIKKMKDS